MTLQELYERLDKATGPDRELDATVTIALLPKEYRWGGSDHNHALGYVYRQGKSGRFLGTAEAETFTASIDAALNLVQRLLPGWVCIGHRTAAGECDALIRDESCAVDIAKEEAPTVPLAILKALVAVLIKKETTQ